MMTLITAAKETSWFRETKNELRQLLKLSSVLMKVKVAWTYLYMHISYVFESCFSAGMVKSISMIFGSLNKEWSNFKKMFFIFL